MVRHGQSVWQVDGDEAGADSPLTTLGELQAHRLGAWLAEHEAVEAVVASDLKRAHRTAEIAASYLDLPVNLEPDLREFDDWEHGWAPLPVSMWATGPDTPDLALGYSEFRARVLGVLQRIATEYGEGRLVLLVAHGGTISTVLRILLGSDTPRLWTWNTARHLIEWRRPAWGANWVLHYFNNMEHLPMFMRTS